MSEEIKQSWHNRLWQWCVRQWDKSKPVITKILYILLALALLGIALASSWSLVQRFIDTSLFQNALGILKSPLALVPALALLVVVIKYPGLKDFQKQIANSIIFGAVAVLFVILCGLEMDINFQNLITTHPPWIYISAMAAVPAVILTWYWKQVNNVVSHEDDVQRLITERFAKATEMLGSKTIEQRLGAIYQLERIAEDSPRDHWTVMETLCAYVRERSPWTEEKQQREHKLETFERKEWENYIKGLKPSTDVQAAMTVISRRKHWEQEEEGQQLDFQGLDLQGLKVNGGRFARALFNKTHLEGAVMVGVNLNHSSFKEAHLYRVNFSKAILEGADFYSAYFSNSIIKGANLNGAIFNDAYLSVAKINEADLEGTQFFGAQLTGVDFFNSNLKNSTFMMAQLKGVSFYYSNLESVNFDGSTLQDIDFSGANLRRARLLVLKLSEAIFTWDTKFPDNFDPEDYDMTCDDVDDEQPDDEDAA